MPMNIQEAYRTPNRLDQKRNFPRHVIIRTTNALNKDRMLKPVWEKCQVTYKGMPIRITPDFSPETMKARRSWTDVIQTLREKQMPAQATIPSQTFNYHRWRNQSITGQNQIHTLSFHKSSPSKDNNRKKKNQYKEGNHSLEKARRKSLSKLKGRQPQEQNANSNNKNKRKQQLLFLNIS